MGTEIRALIPGLLVPAARAVAYSEPSCCFDAFQAAKLGNDVEERRTAIGMDHVRRTVLVEVRYCGSSPLFYHKAFVVRICQVKSIKIS